MPPIKSLEPSALEELCLDVVIKHLEEEVKIVNMVRPHQDTSLLLRRRGIDANIFMAELLCFFDILPPFLSEVVRQKIANRLLTENPTLNSKPEIIGMLETILNEDIKSLHFRDTTLDKNSKIWSIIHKQCSGLQKLLLPSKMVNIQGASMYPLVSKLAQNCPNLTTLVLKDAVTGSNIMTAIGKHCHHLQTLDITGSKVYCYDMLHLCSQVPHQILQTWTSDRVDIDVSNNLLNPLCLTLRTLILSKTNVKSKGAAWVIKVVPNLTTLGEDFVFTLMGLKRLYGNVPAALPKVRLKEVVCQSPSKSKLEFLVRCCPDLETLTLRGDEHRNQLNFANLQKLTLEYINFDSIVEGLQHLPQVVDLTLCSENIDVGQLGMHCPSLKIFTINSIPLKTVTLPSPGCNIFTKLEELKIVHPISRACGELLLTRATNLRVVELVKIHNLTDAIFAEWYKKNQFLHLKTFLLRYSFLTRSTVQLFLTLCPQITMLGEIGSWDIRSWECKRLTHEVKRERYNLQLVLYTSSESYLNDHDFATSDDELLPIL